MSSFCIKGLEPLFYTAWLCDWWQGVALLAAPHFLSPSKPRFCCHFDAHSNYTVPNTKWHPANDNPQWGATPGTRAKERSLLYSTWISLSSKWCPAGTHWGLTGCCTKQDDHIFLSVPCFFMHALFWQASWESPRQQMVYAQFPQA